MESISFMNKFEQVVEQGKILNVAIVGGDGLHFYGTH